MPLVVVFVRAPSFSRRLPILRCLAWPFLLGSLSVRSFTTMVPASWCNKPSAFSLDVEENISIVRRPYYYSSIGLHLHDAAEAWESTPEEDDDDEPTTTKGVHDDEGSDKITTAAENDDDISTTRTSLLQEEYQQWVDAVEKAVVGLEKKQMSLQSELEKAKQVESYTERANLLKSNLYLFPKGNGGGGGLRRSATVQDWETGKEILLELDPQYDSAVDEVESLFQQVRKLKRGAEVVQDLLQSTSSALDNLHKLQRDLLESIVHSSSSDDNDGTTSATGIIDEDGLRLVQERLRRSAETTSFRPPLLSSTKKQARKKGSQQQSSSNKKPVLGTPASNVRKLESVAGSTILVGRNRRGNEYLSLTVARGHDIWMHARGTPGAHVLVLQRRGSNPSATEDCLQFAADLAAFYSDARAERKVEVTAAEPKHIQKPRNAPLGAVKLREEWRVFMGRPDAVPDSLKEARAVSGLADEYRASDKAKLRKLNRKHAAQQKEAKRQAKKRARQQPDKSAEKSL